MNFLIVDDDAVNRLFLKTIIEHNGDSVTEACNGSEAVRLFKEPSTNPDIIIMDVLMPVMDGLQAAKIIRELCATAPEHREKYIPILFMTGLIKEGELKKCFSIGDDVVEKPVTYTMANAKINSLKRHLLMFSELNEKRRALENNYRTIEEEHLLAKGIFEHFMKMNNTDSGNLRFHTSSTSLFNGDIFLCARSPMDSLYVFVGDLTGHGLPAAIAAIPINKIFFTMAAKGISVSTIVKEINQTLYHLLPENIFCAGLLMELSSNGEQIKLWSGGMPYIMITNAQGTLSEVIPSMHMPLGSRSPEEFENNIQLLTPEKDSRLYIFTDGISELEDKKGEQFSEQKIRGIFSSTNESNFDQIIREVNQFSSDGQHDDITLVEVLVNPPAWPTNHREEFIREKSAKLKCALPWEITMHVAGRDFQRGDPASQLINFLSNATGMDLHQDTLSMILTELYSNALEHGLMQLDSRLKGSEEGFVNYYLSRSEGIRKISSETDYVDIHVKFEPDHSNPVITISVTDSGNGFDPDAVKYSDENDLHGRGKKIITSLCHDLIYSNGGRTATATYQLLSPY